MIFCKFSQILLVNFVLQLTTSLICSGEPAADVMQQGLEDLKQLSEHVLTTFKVRVKIVGPCMLLTAVVF